MSITLSDALARLTVPQLKDLVSHLSGAETAGRKDELAFLSRYDGLSSFRLTPLGAYVLGLDAAYQPLAIPSNVALSVLPSLLVNAVRGALGAEAIAAHKETGHLCLRAGPKTLVVRTDHLHKFPARAMNHSGTTTRGASPMRRARRANCLSSNEAMLSQPR
jgi:hypothetical protein